MHRKSCLLGGALVAILGCQSLGCQSVSASEGGGGGAESTSPGGFFAQNTASEGPLAQEQRRRAEEKRIEESLNNKGRVAPKPPTMSQTAPAPVATPPTAGATRDRTGPPPIPAAEASSTQRLAGGDTLYDRPWTERLWESLTSSEPDPGEPPAGWTQRLRLANGWTIYSGYGNYVIAVSPNGNHMKRFLR